MEPLNRKTLLDLDRLPTQKELREFFLANDWSARKPYDFDKWSQEKIEDKNYTQNIFDKIWHKISRKHGQKASPKCYTKDYPPEVLRGNVSDIVSGSVAEIVNEHPEVVQSIFDNLSERLGELIAEQMTCMGPVRIVDVLEASQQVLAIIIRLIDNGDINDRYAYLEPFLGVFCVDTKSERQKYSKIEQLRKMAEEYEQGADLVKELK